MGAVHTPALKPVDLHTPTFGGLDKPGCERGAAETPALKHVDLRTPTSRRAAPTGAQSALHTHMRPHLRDAQPCQAAGEDEAQLSSCLLLLRLQDGVLRHIPLPQQKAARFLSLQQKAFTGRGTL